MQGTSLPAGSVAANTAVRGKDQKRFSRVVPGGGIEPPRAEARRILSPLRLPVPPSRLKEGMLRLAQEVPSFLALRLFCGCLCELRHPSHHAPGLSGFFSC